MDRYFYSLELDENGKQVIHLSGNVYFNDTDETRENYRIAEWKFFYVPVEEAQEWLTDGNFFSCVNFNDKLYGIDNITKKEAENICGVYHNGRSGTELHIRDITEDTPCGDYWFELEADQR